MYDTMEGQREPEEEHRWCSCCRLGYDHRRWRVRKPNPKVYIEAWDDELIAMPEQHAVVLREYMQPPYPHRFSKIVNINRAHNHGVLMPVEATGVLPCIRMICNDREAYDRLTTDLGGSAS